MLGERESLMEERVLREGAKGLMRVVKNERDKAKLDLAKAEQRIKDMD